MLETVAQEPVSVQVDTVWFFAVCAHYCSFTVAEPSVDKYRHEPSCHAGVGSFGSERTWNRVNVDCCQLICTEMEGCCVCTFARQECWVLSKSKLFPQGALPPANFAPLCGREDPAISSHVCSDSNVWFLILVGLTTEASWTCPQASITIATQVSEESCLLLGAGNNGLLARTTKWCL